MLYTLSAIGMLILAALFLHFALVSSLAKEDHEFLADTIRVLRTILRERPENFAVLEHEVKWEGVGQQATQRHYSRILDASGKTIIETPAMDAIIPPSVFTTPVGIKEPVGEGIKWKSRDGTVYLLTTAWAQLDDPARKPLLIQLALDISAESDIIASYRRNLLAVLILGICFSAGIGSVVARQGMRPLEEITASVQRVKVSRLHERIGQAAWPRELTALAA
ncbi:MAG TPA: two-component sensor histidine kinase, partial [Gammaproteobacteria bacterium]|nr:two-component sensor histidine kinase [Gammaproteobacteria bacterium]